MRLSVYKDNLSAGRGADKAVKRFAEEMSRRGHVVNLFDASRFPQAVEEPCDAFVATGSNELVAVAERYPEAFPWPVVLQLHIHPTALFKKDFLRFRKWRFNRALRKALLRVSVVQVLMSSHVEELRRLLGPSCPRVVVIGNALPRQETDCGAIEYRPVILYPAAIQLRLKRQDLLVKAFARLAEDFPDWQVHLYGRGKDEAKLARLIRRLGVSDQVVMKGYGDLAEAYRTCSFVVLTSASEGFGLIVIEGARFGKPTVSCTPGLDGLVRSAQTGLLVDASVEALADGLRGWMSDSAIVWKFGAAARAYAERTFSSEVIGSHWEDLFVSLEGRSCA